jgi:hypothetical protein
MYGGLNSFLEFASGFSFTTQPMSLVSLITFAPFEERGLHIQEQGGQKDRAEDKAFPPLMRLAGPF